MSELHEQISEIFHPQGRPIAEIRAIVEADNRRWYELGDLWCDLSEKQQLELIATAKEMLA